MKKWGMILLALVLAMSLTACGPKADGARNAPAEDAAAGGSAGNAENPRKVVYVPLWMTPNSVVYYDAELNRTIVPLIAIRPMIGTNPFFSLLPFT